MTKTAKHVFVNVEKHENRHFSDDLDAIPDAIRQNLVGYKYFQWGRQTDLEGSHKPKSWKTRVFRSKSVIFEGPDIDRNPVERGNLYFRTLAWPFRDPKNVFFRVPENAILDPKKTYSWVGGPWRRVWNRTSSGHPCLQILKIHPRDLKIDENRWKSMKIDENRWKSKNLKSTLWM